MNKADQADRKYANVYRAGSERADITPPLGLPCLGFRPRHMPMRGVHDPLYAKAVVIEGEGQTAAIVQVDGIGIDNGILGPGRHFTNEVKRRIREETGIREDAILLSWTHAHSTPETVGFRPLLQAEGANEWLEEVMNQIVMIVKRAAGSMAEVSMRTAVSIVEGVAVNRRGGQVDSEMTVIVFECLNQDCGGDIMIVHYACHPVIVQVQELISADFVGGMTEHVLRELPNVKEMMFIQGACADINPICGNSGSWSDVTMVGHRLGREAVELYKRQREVNGSEAASPARVETSGRTLKLPSRMLPSEGERAALQQSVEGLLLELKKRADPSLLQQLMEHEEALWRTWEGSQDYEAELQLIRIGPVLLIGLPCEPFTEMGIALKEAAAAAGCLGVPAGYAGGYLGYIAPPNEWERGGYEVRLGPWSKVAPGGYETLLHACMELIGARLPRQ